MLKPCPFCGLLPYPVELDTGLFAHCANAKCPIKNIDFAVPIWNRRATDPGAEFKRLVLEAEYENSRLIHMMYLHMGLKQTEASQRAYRDRLNRLDAYLKRLGGESASNCELEGEQDG